MTETRIEPVLDFPGLIEPQVERNVAAPRKPGKGTGTFRKWLRRAIVALCILILLPFLLTLLYVPSFVRPVSTLMLGDLITLKGYDRQWVDYDDIAPVMARTVIMSEDGQFCAHKGVDLGELKGVVQDALSGESTRGASTITMQTVKHLYLWNSRSFIRKGAEIPLALYFDLIVPKQRIMEIYLNIAEWGDGIYGVEAAAQHYFKVPAKNLTPRQAALLTIALPNPATRNPKVLPRELQPLSRRIQARASRSGGYDGCL